MPERSRRTQLGAAWSREWLRTVESRAIRIRALLHDVVRHRTRGDPGATDDALKLCKAVERLARYGMQQDFSAADAIDFCERVQLLFEQLKSEVDGILASIDYHTEW